MIFENFSHARSLWANPADVVETLADGEAATGAESCPEIWRRGRRGGPVHRRHHGLWRRELHRSDRHRGGRGDKGGGAEGFFVGRGIARGLKDNGAVFCVLDALGEAACLIERRRGSKEPAGGAHLLARPASLNALVPGGQLASAFLVWFQAVIIQGESAPRLAGGTEPRFKPLRVFCRLLCYQPSL